MRCDWSAFGARYLGDEIANKLYVTVHAFLTVYWIEGGLVEVFKLTGRAQLVACNFEDASRHMKVDSVVTVCTFNP